MNFVLAVLVLVVIGLSVLAGKLWLMVDDINEELDELDEDITSTFGDVGGYIGALTVRADRFEAQLGGAANSMAQSGDVSAILKEAQSGDVSAILKEAQVWAAANEPVPVVPGFVGFPQDYDPSYHFGGQQFYIPKLSETGSTPVDYSRDV